MTWSVSPQVTKAPVLLDALMLALGKSLYLACEFERKCQDELIGKTIANMVKTRALAPEEIDGLEKARLACNYIAHDSGKIGQLNYMRPKDVAESLASLRSAVIDLAIGDNIISVWQFEMQEKLSAPLWMTQTYVARTRNWVFGDRFEEPDHL